MADDPDFYVGIDNYNIIAVINGCGGVLAYSRPRANGCGCSSAGGQRWGRSGGWNRTRGDNTGSVYIPLEDACGWRELQLMGSSSRRAGPQIATAH